MTYSLEEPPRGPGGRAAPGAAEKTMAALLASCGDGEAKEPAVPGHVVEGACREVEVEVERRASMSGGGPYCNGGGESCVVEWRWNVA